MRELTAGRKDAPWNAAARKQAPLLGDGERTCTAASLLFNCLFSSAYLRQRLRFGLLLFFYSSAQEKDNALLGQLLFCGQNQKKMDVLPMCSIFQELQIVHDTGYFSALPSLEEYWQQVNIHATIALSPLLLLFFIPTPVHLRFSVATQVCIARNTTRWLTAPLHYPSHAELLFFLFNCYHSYYMVLSRKGERGCAHADWLAADRLK